MNKQAIYVSVMSRKNKPFPLLSLNKIAGFINSNEVLIKSLYTDHGLCNETWTYCRCFDLLITPSATQHDIILRGNTPTPTRHTLNILNYYYTHKLNIKNTINI